MLNGLMIRAMVAVLSVVTIATADEAMRLSKNQVWRLLGEQTQTVMNALMPGGSGALHRAHQLMWTAPHHARSAPVVRQPRYAVLSITGPPMMQSHEQQLLDVAVAARTATGGGHEVTSRSRAGSQVQSDSSVKDASSNIDSIPQPISNTVGDKKEAPYSVKKGHNDEIIYGRPVNPFLTRKTGTHKDFPGDRTLVESEHRNKIKIDKASERLRSPDFSTSSIKNSPVKQLKVVEDDGDREWKSALKMLNRSGLIDHSITSNPSQDAFQSFISNDDAFEKIKKSGKNRISEGFSEKEGFVANFPQENSQIKSIKVHSPKQSNLYKPKPIDKFHQTKVHEPTNFDNDHLKPKHSRSGFIIDNTRHTSLDDSIPPNVFPKRQPETREETIRRFGKEFFSTNPGHRKSSEFSKPFFPSFESGGISGENGPISVKNSEGSVKTEKVIDDSQIYRGFRPLLFPSIVDKESTKHIKLRDFENPIPNKPMSKYSDKINDKLSGSDFFEADFPTFSPQAEEKTTGFVKTIKESPQPQLNEWFVSDFEEDSKIGQRPSLETPKLRLPPKPKLPVKDSGFSYSSKDDFQFDDDFFEQAKKITPALNNNANRYSYTPKAFEPSRTVSKTYSYTPELFKPSKTDSKYMSATRFGYQSNKRRPVPKAHQLSNNRDIMDKQMYETPQSQEEHFRKTLGNIAKIKDVDSRFEKYRSFHRDPHSKEEFSSYREPSESLSEKDQLNGLDTTVQKLENAKLKADSIFNGSYEEFDKPGLQIDPIATEVENNLKYEWNLVTQTPQIEPLPMVEQNTSPPKENDHIEISDTSSYKPLDYSDEVNIADLPPFPDIPIPTRDKKPTNSNSYVNNGSNVEITTKIPEEHQSNAVFKNESFSPGNEMNTKMNDSELSGSLTHTIPNKKLTNNTQTDPNIASLHEESIERSAVVLPHESPKNEFIDTSKYDSLEDKKNYEINIELNDRVHGEEPRDDLKHEEIVNVAKDVDISPHSQSPHMDSNTESNYNHKDRYTNNNRRSFFFFDGYHTENGGANDHFPRTINHHAHPIPDEGNYHQVKPELPLWWQEAPPHREPPIHDGWFGTPVVHSVSQTPLFRRYKATTTYRPRIFVSPQRIKSHHVSVTSSPLLHKDKTVTIQKFESEDAVDSIERPFTDENTKTPTITTSSPSTHTHSPDVELLIIPDKKHSSELTKNSEQDEKNTTKVQKDEFEPIKVITTVAPQHEDTTKRKSIPPRRNKIVKNKPDHEHLKRNELPRKRIRFPLQTTIAPMQHKEVIVKKVTFPAFPGTSDKIQLGSIVKFGERINPKHRDIHDGTNMSENNRRRKIPTSLRSRIRKLRLDSRFHSNSTGQQENQNDQENPEGGKTEPSTTLKVLRITTEPTSFAADERTGDEELIDKISTIDDQDNESTKRKLGVLYLQDMQEWNEDQDQELFVGDTTTPSASEYHTDPSQLAASGSSRITMVIPTDAVAAMRNLDSDTMDLVLENNSETEDANVDVTFDDNTEETDLILTVPNAEDISNNQSYQISTDSILDIIDLVEDPDPASEDSLVSSSENEKIITRNTQEISTPKTTTTESLSTVEISSESDSNTVFNSTSVPSNESALPLVTEELSTVSTNTAAKTSTEKIPRSQQK